MVLVLLAGGAAPTCRSPGLPRAADEDAARPAPAESRARVARPGRARRPRARLRAGPGRRPPADPPQAHAPRLQAARAQRQREHAAGLGPQRGPGLQARQALPRPRAQLQRGHRLQGRGGDRRRSPHDAGQCL